MEDLPNGPDEGKNDLKNPLDDSSDSTPKPEAQPEEKPAMKMEETKANKPKKSKLGLIIAVIVVLLAGSAAAYYFFMYEPAGETTETTETEVTVDEEPPSLEAEVDPGLQGFAQKGVATKKSEADFLVFDADDKNKNKEKVDNWKKNKDKRKQVKTELKSDTENLGVTHLHAYEDQSMKDIVESIGPEAKALAVLVHDPATKKWHMTPNTYYKSEAMLKKFEQKIEELTDRQLDEYQKEVEDYMEDVTVKAGQGYMVVSLNPTSIYGSGDRYVQSPNGFDVCSSSESGWYLIGIDSQADWTTQIDDCFSDVKTVWSITDWFEKDGKKKNFRKIYSRNESDSKALSNTERLANLKKLDLTDQNILWVHKDSTEVQPPSDHGCTEVNVTTLLKSDLENWFVKDLKESYSTEQVRSFAKIFDIAKDHYARSTKLEEADLPDMNEILKEVFDKGLYKISPIHTKEREKTFLVTMNLEVTNSVEETMEFLDQNLQRVIDAVKEGTAASKRQAVEEESGAEAEAQKNMKTQFRETEMDETTARPKVSLFLIKYFTVESDEDCPIWAMGEVVDVTEILSNTETRPSKVSKELAGDICDNALPADKQLSVYLEDFFVEGSTGALGEDGKIALESLLRTIMENQKEYTEKAGDIEAYVREAVEKGVYDLGDPVDTGDAEGSVMVVFKPNLHSAENIPTGYEKLLQDYKFQITLSQVPTKNGCEVWVVKDSKDVTEYVEIQNKFAEKPCKEVIPVEKIKTDFNTFFIDDNATGIEGNTKQFFTSLIENISEREKEHGNNVDPGKAHEMLKEAATNGLVTFSGVNTEVTMEINFNNLAVQMPIPYFDYSYKLYLEKYQEDKSGCDSYKLVDEDDVTSYTLELDGAAMYYGSSAGENKSCEAVDLIGIVQNNVLQFTDNIYDAIHEKDKFIKEFGNEVVNFIVQNEVEKTQATITGPDVKRVISTLLDNDKIDFSSSGQEEGEVFKYETIEVFMPTQGQLSTAYNARLKYKIDTQAECGVWALDSIETTEVEPS